MNEVTKKVIQEGIHWREEDIRRDERRFATAKQDEEMALQKQQSLRLEISKIQKEIAQLQEDLNANP